MGAKMIYFIEKNIRGAWVVYGIDGVKQYYGYTKAEARRKYIDDCRVITATQGRAIDLTGEGGKANVYSTGILG